MKIQPAGIQNQYKGNSSLNFKSCYPVTYWVAESNGSYAPAISIDLVKKLQGIVVRFLNSKNGKYTGAKDTICRKVKSFISSVDKDYRNTDRVRSFYNKYGNNKNGKEPLSYLITGLDAQYFDLSYGQPIGAAKVSTGLNGFNSSAEQNLALGDYYNGGLNFVKKRAKEFCDINKMPYGLHVKLEAARTKTGKIKDYIIKDMKFFPEKGPQNPFEKIKGNI